MSVYREFCTEVFDDHGNLASFALDYPENFNFGYDVVDRIADSDPEKTAIVWCNTAGEEHVFTFEDVRVKSNQFANVLLEAGIGKGDKVMVVLKRHYEYWFSSIALHKIGAVLLPVTHMLTADDLAYRMESADVKAVISTPTEDMPGKVLEAAERCGNKAVLFSVQEGAKGFRNLTVEGEAASKELSRIPTKATEIMVMYFTSGTTGYPKGVMHDHTYPLAHIITAKYWHRVQDGGLHFTVAETGWAKASWGKLYGQWLAGSAVMVYDFENFDPRQLMTIINRYQVTTFCAPPTVYRYLVRKGIIPMPSLVHATTAGEALNPEVFDKFYAATGIPLMEGFGQTESTVMLAHWGDCELRPGSMGKPTPLYHVELVDENGDPVPVGDVGELVVCPPESGKQYGIFTGYHENEALYQRVWRGGMYHTGDTAYRDAEGYFWFHGRIDDLIKTGGFRVGPFEIENVLMQHPAVMECSVVGVPDVLRGQAIEAAVVLSPEYTRSTDLTKEIKEFCNVRLAEYKWIRQLKIIEVMPKTISGKIRKVDLRASATQ